MFPNLVLLCSMFVYFSSTENYARHIRGTSAGPEGFPGTAGVLRHRQPDAQHHLDPEKQSVAER